MIAKIALYIPIPGFRDTTDVVRKNIHFAEDSLKRYQSLVKKDPENPPPTLFTKLFKGEEDDIRKHKLPPPAPRLLCFELQRNSSLYAT